MTGDRPIPPEEDADFIKQLSALTVTAEQLAKDVPNLAKAVDKNRASQRRLRAGFVLIVLALGASGYGLYVQHQTSEQETRTNNEVLCPLYGALVASFTPAQRALIPPERLATYDKTVITLKEAYRVLGCPS